MKPIQSHPKVAITTRLEMTAQLTSSKPATLRTGEDENPDSDSNMGAIPVPGIRKNYTTRSGRRVKFPVRHSDLIEIRQA